MPFCGIWLEAPEPLLHERLTHRTADASDADARVLRMQQAEGAADITWRRIDASVEAERVVAAAAAACIGARPAADS